VDERKLSDPASPSSPRPRIGLARSFYFAFAGLFYLFRTQRNARIESVIGLIVCALAWWLKVSRVEWAILVVMIAIVLILEGLNTAIEAAVDLASPEFHPLAKVAKDVTAGMVLIAAVTSIIVGLLILGPPLAAQLSRGMGVSPMRPAATSSIFVESEDRFAIAHGPGFPRSGR
jgi:diacylglycerol kinase